MYNYIKVNSFNFSVNHFKLGGIVMKLKKIFAFIFALAFVLVIPLSSAYAFTAPSSNHIGYRDTRWDSYYNRESTRGNEVYSSGYKVWVCVNSTLHYKAQYYSLMESDGSPGYTYLGKQWISPGHCAVWDIGTSYLDGGNNKADLFIVTDDPASVDFYD